MRGRGNIAGLWLIWALWPLSFARAEAQVQPRIHLVLDGELAGASGLDEAVLSQVADLDVKVVMEPASGSLPSALLVLARSHRAPEDRGVVWVTRAGADVFVWVASPAADKSLLRSLPNADPASFSTQETVAVIVRSSMEGLLAQAPIDFVPKQVPSVAVTPVTLPSKPELFLPELTVAYVGASFSKEVPWQHGGRLSAGVYDLFTTGPYAQLAISILRDERVVDQGVSLLLTRTPLEAVLGTRFSFGAFAIAPELSVGVELTSRDAQARAADVKATAERRRFAAVLGAQAFLLTALGGPRARSFLLMGGGVEAVLNNVDYRVEILRGSEPGSTTSILVSPRSFRPVARLGLRVLL